MEKSEQIAKLFQDFQEEVMKVLEIKEEKRFTPPELDAVMSYFHEQGYKTETAMKAWNYYSQANWKDSKGNKIKNWKQKMIGVWFKPENKEPISKPVDETNKW